MASTVGRLFQDRSVQENAVWMKPDASKSSKKGGGGLAGRKPLGDLSNAIKKPSSASSLNQTSKKASFAVGGKASGKNRKVLSDISNSAKLQKGNETSKKTVVNKKLSVVPEEPQTHECGVGREEGFLHNHDECIKAQNRAMDVDEFMKIIAMDTDFSNPLDSPRARAMTSRFEADSPERNYKLLIEDESLDFELSTAGKFDSSPCWSPTASPGSDRSWMDRDDDFLNFKLMDSP